MARTAIGRDLGVTGPRAGDHAGAQRLQRQAQGTLDDVTQQKRSAALADPGADVFAETARRVKRGAWPSEHRDSFSDSKRTT